MTIAFKDQFQRAAEVFIRQRPGMVIATDSLTMLSVIAFLQLALRHPDIDGSKGDRVRNFVASMLANIATTTPDLARMLRMLDDAGDDVPR